MARISIFSFCFVLLLTLHSSVSAQKHKVIFDCDLGDDVDDAFALAMLVSSPDIEVLGVVLDYGHTEMRGKMASRFLYEIGREDIPVVVGRMTHDRYSARCNWGRGFEKNKPIEQEAADFIIETLRKHPNEVTLITVGPVPNIADVIEKDPEALGLAKNVYSMFGSFYVGYNEHPVPDAEWNVRAAEGPAKTFAASGADITYAGLDITNVKFREELRKRILERRSPLTDFLSACYTLWRSQTGNETPTLYDPVAIGMLIWPDLFTTRPAHVRVIDGGFTVVDESKPPNSRIGMAIDKEEFLDRLMELYLSQNFNRFD